MNKQEREAAVKQGIIGLILKWKLSSAEVDLTKNENVLTDPTRKELKGLLEQYRGYDKLMFSAQENCEKNPVTARMMMSRIPQEILITHPSYRRINTKLQKRDVMQLYILRLRKTDLRVFKNIMIRLTICSVSSSDVVMVAHSVDRFKHQSDKVRVRELSSQVMDIL